MRPAAAAFSEMRPSCGFRRSAMSSFASTFRRVVTPGAIRFGIRCTSCEHAVDAEADDERVLLRLEVDVGGAVLGGLEDDRVDEADERRVGDAVLGLEVVGLLLLVLEVVLGLLEHRAGAEGLGGARHPAQLGEDVLARRDAEVERVAGREPELVDAVQVAGVGDGDRSAPSVERVRDRDDALEHVQRNLLRGVPRRRPSSARSTSGDLVADGERAGDPLGRGDALVDDRLRERALARAAAHERELVGGRRGRWPRAGRRRARPSR